MIVGTAGHIDHGKTTLVRALTGVDTDRLPEEKARGISIGLGYAFLPVPGTPAAEPIGFIDVPGHERLVHTMLAGATGIDFALLLVAADDGVMPQTREHLAVLSLLGLARGAVAITKIDRVGADRVAEVRAEVALLLAGTALAGVPVLAVSAASGDGVEALRDGLFDAARAAGPGTAAGGDVAFRLAIDRAFTLDGTGTVATGTVHAGRLRVGDEVVLAPPGSGPVRARVRSLHAQNRPVAEARAGERCAVALAGVARTAVARGQWLVDPAAVLATDRLDVRLTVWPAAAAALRSGTRVHVHIGAGATLGTVAVLDAGEGAAAADRIAPGGIGWVQLVLSEPVAAWRGDRVVLRDASATRTLAGGEVLDPFGPPRYRRTPERLAELAAATHGDPASRLAARLEAAAGGVALQRWACAEGLSGLAALPALPAGSLRATETADGGDWALGAAWRETLALTALAALRHFHDAEPESVGPDAARLRRLTAPRLASPLWHALLAALRRDGRIALRGAFVHLPEHGARLSAADERLARKIAPIVAGAGAEGCWARDLARDIGESEALTRTTIARLAQRGEVHQVVRDLCYAPAAIESLAAKARALAAVGGGAVTAAAFRDATGLGRKRAIQVLEYFDRIGLLRRSGDAHRLRTDTRLFCETDR